MKPNMFSAARVAGAALSILLLAAGCSSLPPQPAMDLSGPGWVIREGRVTWHRKSADPGIPGRLQVAMHWDGRSVVTFTALSGESAVAQISTNGWQVRALGAAKFVTGRGLLPERSVWLQLPDGLLGNSAIATDWIMARERGQPWRFYNEVLGESLEGTLATIRMPPQHRIQPDEHMIRVVRRYGITVEALRGVNPGRDLDWFRIGNVINLPELPRENPVQP